MATNYGFITETLLVIFCTYFKWLNIPLGTRMSAFPHFMIPALSWFCTIFFYDEMRKYLIRGGIGRSATGRVKYTGWFARNVYY